MTKKNNISNQVKKWDDIGTPYCLYCFKELIGKKKWKGHKFCSTEHRDLHKMVKSRAIKETSDETKEVRLCENVICDNELTKYQFKFCSPTCRIEVSKSKSTKKVCAVEDCDNFLPKRNEKYCSMICRDKERARKAREERDNYWIKIQCRNCGKVVEKTRAQADKFHNKFCSQLCYIEWQHKDDDGAGSRFMWDTRNNPVKSKKGLVEHFNEHFRKYVINLIDDNSVTSWEFPTSPVIIDKGFQYIPNIIVEYKDGHKEVIEIAERGQSIQDRSSYRWQLLEFKIMELDPTISQCKIVFIDEIQNSYE